jgi:hypothetical protein
MFSVLQEQNVVPVQESVMWQNIVVDRMLPVQQMVSTLQVLYVELQQELVMSQKCVMV